MWKGFDKIWNYFFKGVWQNLKLFLFHVYKDQEQLFAEKNRASSCLVPLILNYTLLYRLYTYSIYTVSNGLQRP
jgi:hypothetical protein